MRSHLSAITAAVLVGPALLALAAAPAHATATAHAAAPRCGGLTATILGTPGKDTIQGTRGDDVIVGRGRRDKIFGGGGDDVICGERGRDRIDGGGGNDRVYGQWGYDRLRGGSGNDALSGGLGWSFFLADAGADVYRVARRAGEYRDRETVVVNFRAAPGPVSVDLGAGTASGWGNDRFHFGDSPVLLSGSTHSDTLIGSSRGERLAGVSGFDTIKGKGGGDNLVARQGVLLGGDGNDYLTFARTTPDGDLTLSGGPGNDKVDLRSSGSGPPEDINLAGGDGIDHFDLFAAGSSSGSGLHPLTFNMTTGALDPGGTSGTASGFEDLTAWSFASTDVVGTDGPNVLEFMDGGPLTVHGLAGDDVIEGDSGDDTLDGGLGDDTADGNSGTDTCTSIEHATDCEILNP